MAPLTNMPDNVKQIAMQVTADIKSGKLDPFGGKFSAGDLLGMQDYLPGIDAMKPN